MLPAAAKTYQKSQIREQQAALSAMRREWRRMGADFDVSWGLIAGSLVAITSTAQRRLAEDAVEYVPNVLEDTGQARAISAVADVRPEAFAGVTGSGNDLLPALYVSVIAAKTAVGDGMPVRQALTLGEERLMRAASTALSDAGRAAERVSMAVRPVSGYVRMLTPPSCSRCVILAGVRYRSETAFQRHPRCDCRHIPVSESVGDDIVDSPQAYFDSLPTAAELDDKYPYLTVKMRQESGLYSQEDIFTKAGAEAIRNGADMNQVVNARRGMYTTKDGMQFTREGVTRRGFYGSEQRRRGTPGRKRYMPEQIQAIARDKDDYLRLLKQYGYIL